MAKSKSEKLAGTLVEWERELEKAKHDHYDSERFFSQLDGVMVWLSISLSTIVGGTLLVDSLSQWVPSDIAKGVGALVSLAAGGLITLQRTLKYAERAEKHRMAGAGFSKLLDDVKGQLAISPRFNQRQIQIIIEQRDETRKLAPGIPRHIYYRKAK